MRTRRKLIWKTTWFKTKRRGQNEDKNDINKKKKGGAEDRGADGSRNNIPLSTPRSVLFVGQTPGGELASQLRELFTRLEPTVGFYIKVVESTGQSLQSLFPLNKLWEER